jgi:hypothetical protein
VEEYAWHVQSLGFNHSTKKKKKLIKKQVRILFSHKE